MQDTLKIALIQTDLVWENPTKNRENFTKKIASIVDDVDVVVLPEMFTTGLTMQAKKVAEPMDGITVNWMKQLASKKNAAIVGSLVIKENNEFYNRLLFVESNGQITHYDKRHTFTLVGEEKIYTAGKNKVIVDYKGWKICPLICYDLRFPVWARNSEDYHVLLYVANWPTPRVFAWDALLRLNDTFWGLLNLASKNTSLAFRNIIGTIAIGFTQLFYNYGFQGIRRFSHKEGYIPYLSRRKEHFTSGVFKARIRV